MCDEESNARFDQLMGRFVSDLYEAQESLKKEKIEFGYAKMHLPWNGRIEKLRRMWLMILGGAVALDLSERVIKDRRDEIASGLGLSLDSQFDVWFSCKPEDNM